MSKPLKIFVSSTWVDLESHRQLVIANLRKLQPTQGISVLGMEDFGASSLPPTDKCLSKVRHSDIYIGIIGMRYGSIPEGETKSMTQLEYEEACRIEIPRYIYLIDESQHLITAAQVDTGENAKLLADFKSQLTNKHTFQKFKSESDLSNRITIDLMNNGHLSFPSFPATSQQAANGQTGDQITVDVDVLINVINSTITKENIVGQIQMMVKSLLEQADVSTEVEAKMIEPISRYVAGWLIGATSAVARIDGETKEKQGKLDEDFSETKKVNEELIAAQSEKAKIKEDWDNKKRELENLRIKLR